MSGLCHTLSPVVLLQLLASCDGYIAQNLVLSRREHHLCSSPLSPEHPVTPAHGSTAAEPQQPRTFYLSGNSYVQSKPEAMIVHMTAAIAEFCTLILCQGKCG